MTHFKQLALAVCDASVRLAVERGKKEVGGEGANPAAAADALGQALGRLIQAGTAAMEALAPPESPPAPPPPPPPEPLPPPSRWQTLADEWGVTLLVLRSVQSHVYGEQGCIEYVVRGDRATQWESNNFIDRIDPRTRGTP